LYALFLSDSGSLWKSAKYFSRVANFDGLCRYEDELPPMICESRYRLGCLRQRGIGATERSPAADAVKYLKLAADAGHVDAQFQLALHTEAGIGTARDPETALQLFEAPASAGNPRAQNRRGYLLEKTGNIEGAMALYDAAARAGHLRARYNLGRLLRSRGELVAAADEFRAAADGGVRAAAHSLALLIEPTDPTSALRYYRIAAVAGLAPAQFNLARLLKDDDAFRWCRKAADQGHTRAQYRTAVLLDTAGDLATAFGYYDRAARSGHQEARFRASMFMIRGLGTAVNLNAGYSGIQQLAGERHPHACAVNAAAILAQNPSDPRGLEDATFAAETGNYLGQCALGCALLGTERERALGLLRASADAATTYELKRFDSCEHGFRDAQFELGRALETEDPEASHAFYLAAAEQHHPRAAVKCVRGNPDDPAVAGFREDAAAVSRPCAAVYSASLWSQRKFSDTVRVFAKHADREPRPRYGVAYLIYAYALEHCGNFPAAFHFFGVAAANGRPDAGFDIGRFLEFGRYGRRDYAAAIGYYRQASNTSVPVLEAPELLRHLTPEIEDVRPQAHFRLGRCYELGRGVPKDIPTAQQEYQQSGIADARLHSSLLHLEFSTDPDVQTTAIQTVVELSDSGHVGAKTTLGIWRYSGKHHYANDPNPDEGREMVRSAAEVDGDLTRGYPLAQAFYGVERARAEDYTEANRFLRAAADRDEPLAQRFYGLHLERGLGFPAPNLRAARQYYELAVDLDDSASMFFLADLLYRRFPDERGTALSLCKRAADAIGLLTLCPVA
jgi:TPR repeat protein